MLNKNKKQSVGFDDLPKSEQKRLLKERRRGEELLDFINSGGDDQIEFGIFNYKSKSKVNAKPMNNDLAMLNTDTGYRDIYVYKVDSDSIG